jgi:hypothetical protein
MIYRNKIRLPLNVSKPRPDPTPNSHSVRPTAPYPYPVAPTRLPPVMWRRALRRTEIKAAKWSNRAGFLSAMRCHRYTLQPIRPSQFFPKTDQKDEFRGAPCRPQVRGLRHIPKTQHYPTHNSGVTHRNQCGEVEPQSRILLRDVLPVIHALHSPPPAPPPPPRFPYP